MQLITGNRWGDDWLKVPTNKSDRDALEEIMRESNWAIEIHENIPLTHRHLVES